MAAVKSLFLLFWLYLIFTCALLLFTKGFLLKRVVVNNSSKCEDNHWAINNLWHGVTRNIRLQQQERQDFQPCNRLVKPKFSKAVLVVIDGLRYDFLQFHNLTSVALPYQNRMKKLHEILQSEPTNGRLYKFEADPPTTTMQRIKGMTTGSLPTFIDAGTNFDSYEITEDNILDHALKKNRNISFMGCSTWTELFPKHFHRKLPFSALNVKDLDTIDYGIMKHLVPEIKRDDWSIIIAHFLGVDHCGHRYGTHHPEMTRKLTEMDNVISDLVKTIDNDTILFVMGDHGMTISGDHGGDSVDEVMAGLFTYSKHALFTPEHSPLPQVSQIDLVPTLSLLLDQPIPFSNLGTVIPDFFNSNNSFNFLPGVIKKDIHRFSNKKQLDLTTKLFQNLNLAYLSFLNCQQILTYINEYQLLSGDLPLDQIEVTKASYEFLEDKLEDNLNSLVVIDWVNETDVTLHMKDIKESIEELRYLHQSFQDVLQNVKQICRRIWAKFDVVSMSMGLSLMMFIAIVVLISPTLTPTSSLIETNKSSILISFIGFSFTVFGLVYLAVPFQDVEMTSIVVFLAVSFSFSLWLLLSGVSLRHNQILHCLKLADLEWKFLVALICFFVYLFSLFTNSYIIYEDSTTLFFCQSLIFYYAINHFVFMLKNHKSEDLNKTKGFILLKTRIRQQIANKDAFRFYIMVTVLMVCLRWTKYFWFCREMQLKCSLSPYSLPLVALLSEFNKGFIHERLMLAVVAMVLLVVSTYFYLKKQGNLNGFTSCVFVVKYVGVVSTVTILFHWNLQLVLTHKMSAIFNIPHLQQILLPRFVYVLFLLSVGCLIYNPLCLHIIFQDKFQKSFNNGGDDLNSITDIYKELKLKYTRDALHHEPKPPIVYGLKTIFSSSYVVILFILSVVASLVLSDGMAFPLLLLWFSSFCLSRLFSLDEKTQVCGYMSVLVSMLMWNFFASLGFFATGHQTTLPGIRFHAAYIGFKGSMPEMVPQVIVILLNTFASQIVCAFAIPLLLLFQTICKKGDHNEAVVFHDVTTARVNLFRMMIIYIAIYMLKVSMAASSAALHRRHLMVWKIFAPRFLFEAVGFMVTTLILLLSLTYFNRIEITLKQWLAKLEEIVELSRICNK